MIPDLSRRHLLAGSAAALIARPFTAAAAPCVPRIGIQIFQFLEQAIHDLPGTLKTIAAIGYTNVELMTGLGPPAEVAALVKRNGLSVPSMHVTATPIFPNVPSLTNDLDAIIDSARIIGARYIVCSLPYLPPDRHFASPDEIPQILMDFSLADWQAHCDFLNRVAEPIANAGLTLAYHNHIAEFRGQPGRTGFDLLLATTNRKSVTLELDCGWAFIGGQDPAALLRRYPGHIRLIHLKDFAPGQDRSLGLQSRSVPLGQGVIDWRAVLSAAGTAGVEAAYVEQEAPFSTSPAEAAKASFDYLKTIGCLD